MYKMMRKTIQISLLLGSCLCCASFAAAPVGTASSSGPFELGGATVRPEGVPSWPVVAGDAIQAGPHTIFIRLKDGTRVTLRAQSRAIIEEREGGLSFRLLTGSMAVVPVANSNLSFYRNSQLVSAPVSSETVVALSTPAGSKPAGDASLSARRPLPTPVSTR